MGDETYRAFMDLLMCADPWPVENGEKGESYLKAFADEEAIKRGFTDWIEALHKFDARQTKIDKMAKGYGG